VANGRFSGEAQENIRQGNQKVLVARLRDALFFWNNDRQKSLRDFAGQLDRIMFHVELGSVRDKVQRLKELAQRARPMLQGLVADRLEELLELAKADLATSMVYEFPELEGTAGMLYAREEGMDEDLAQSILEHRMPRSADDALPSPERPGLAASLLDRVDSLVGYFGIGAGYSGSGDPFGLRRMMLGLIRLVQHSGEDLDLNRLAALAAHTYAEKLPDHEQALARFSQFLAERLTATAQEEGVPPDLARAAAVHAARPLAYARCLEALRQAPLEMLQELAEQCKRMVKIVAEPAGQLDGDLAQEPVERDMVRIVQQDAPPVMELAGANDFPAAMQRMMTWMPTIRQYFDDVLINHEDATIRRFRHRLVKSLSDALRSIADFTQVVKQSG
jgi:glycyl-tRNA synthetase beta chain